MLKITDRFADDGLQTRITDSFTGIAASEAQNDRRLKLLAVVSKVHDHRMNYKWRPSKLRFTSSFSDGCHKNSQLPDCFMEGSHDQTR